jgi:nucleotide-binding universal stress UspA family protein
MTIVVGYLMSDEGRAALDRAMQEAKLRDARLVVAHSLRGGPRDEQEQARAYRDELERIERKLQAEPITSEVRELMRGRPAGEDLVGVATDEGAELLVIGLRRRNPVGKLALGSNARDVLLHARCPVLAVKAE